MMVSGLKTLVFLLCIFGIPILMELLFGWGMNSLEESYTICLVSWIIASILTWIIGKALQGRPTGTYGQAGYHDHYQSYGQSHQGPQMTQVHHTDPYRRSHYQGLQEPQVHTGRGAIYHQASHRSRSYELFSKHICKSCGGPVDLKTRKCIYCGSRN